MLAAEIKQLSLTYAATHPVQSTIQKRRNPVSEIQVKQSFLGQQIGRQAQGWHKRRTSAFLPFISHCLSLRLDSYLVAERILSALGISPSSTWRKILRYLLIDFGYISLTRQVYLDSGQGLLLSDHRMRLKIVSPVARYHFQTSSLCRQLNVYPIIPCQSPIFKLCLEGNIDAVKIWFINRWISPTVTNQHGENLLHVSDSSPWISS